MKIRSTYPRESGVRRWDTASVGADGASHYLRVESFSRYDNDFTAAAFTLADLKRLHRELGRYIAVADRPVLKAVPVYHHPGRWMLVPSSIDKPAGTDAVGGLSYPSKARAEADIGNVLAGEAAAGRKIA